MVVYYFDDFKSAINKSILCDIISLKETSLRNLPEAVNLCAFMMGLILAIESMSSIACISSDAYSVVEPFSTIVLANMMYSSVLMLVVPNISEPSGFI